MGDVTAITAYYYTEYPDRDLVRIRKKHSQVENNLAKW